MPKGSLEKWLRSADNCLDIPQILNIVIDVASALEYLHYGCSTPFVHFDLKPSNILLDEDMVAHLGDFGIVKLLGEGESITQIQTLTIGYIAPEYGREEKASRKSGVYCYGIMLIETIKRKKPADEKFVLEMSLKSWVNDSLPDSIMKDEDAHLLSKKDEYFATEEQCVVYLKFGNGLYQKFTREKNQYARCCDCPQENKSPF
ncbi:unnamed protein product [Dovyalis caffra]|uniref:Protein kinase domain-containing protein n=1 Tax=Dovyalis caffra TaxID=77055 RepID=A0AAV1R1E3_9ROSI|nr:unnamed protein product [Dovyalis caffra]